MTPWTPAHVLGCDGADRACPGCAAWNRTHRLRGRNRARDLPRELVVLRDPRTGEPLEVT